MKTDFYTKFNELNWVSTQINHNQKIDRNDCIFGVPVYKNNLSITEKASLNQLCKIIGNDYEICLICPDDIDLTEYNEIANNYNIKLSTLFCNKQYFKGTTSYSYMCETVDFYKCFNEYKYLFIYQLDGWIFENKVKEYLDLNVDYIGSPWNAGCFGLDYDTVGNGGISLRRVQKFIEICEKFEPEDFDKEFVKKEDLFFCKTMKRKSQLKTPHVKIASNFALSGLWLRFMFKYNNGKLPMCVHAWDKDLRFWAKYIKI